MDHFQNPQMRMKPNSYFFSGPTSTPESGPLYDHTFKNETGHYLLLEGSLGNPGSAAVLRSPNINFGAYTVRVSPDANFPEVIYR